MRAILALLTLITIGCGSGATMTPPMQSGPITMQNPSVRKVAEGSYNVTFVLTNNAYQSSTIVRADLVRLMWGGQIVSADIGCTGAPFVSTEQTTPVITVNLKLASGMAIVNADCGNSGTDYTTEGTPASAPKSGDEIVVAIDGILNDAAPFTAAASAPVL